MTDNVLVLGVGGVRGVAWETGVLAGLAEHGVDLTDADLVVGTSAGSIVGADLRSGTDLGDLYKAQSVPLGSTEVYARMGRGVMLKYVTAVAFARKPAVALRRVGSIALAAKVETEAERRRVFEGRLSALDWPAGDLKITAVEAVTGEFTVFDAASGVSL